MKLVKVLWHDPTTLADWQSEEDWKKPLDVIETYGMLLANNKDVVVVAGTISPTPKDIQDKRVADVSVFPAGCILSVEEL